MINTVCAMLCSKNFNILIRVLFLCAFVCSALIWFRFVVIYWRSKQIGNRTREQGYNWTQNKYAVIYRSMYTRSIVGREELKTLIVALSFARLFEVIILPIRPLHFNEYYKNAWHEPIKFFQVLNFSISKHKTSVHHLAS